ncbi:CAP domain-containing protein [Cytobacillus firmus]|uniref:CAP domain-containing protein n=1 Tax=Cytobacillus firmus TaxID=1399 RepID=UPI00222823A6|nr:CAP domain-containing protein [Cytobacillus firmus]
MNLKKNFLLGLFLILMLAACNNNAEQGMQSGALTGEDLQEISNTNNVNVDRERRGAAPLELQRVNNGYLTIDPNSYSTATPSQEFPHSQLTDDGGMPLFQFGEDQQQDQGMTPQQPESRQFAQPDRQEGGQQQPESAAPQADRDGGQAPAAQNDEINNFESKVIELTNAERQKNGLNALKSDNPLSNVAQAKSNDMQQKNYFSHTSPTYGSPFDMMRDFGVNYSSAGENIAMGQQTPEQVVQAWMESEGHRKNILNGTFTHIGVGYTENGSYWTQMFIAK